MLNYIAKWVHSCPVRILHTQTDAHDYLKLFLAKECHGFSALTNIIRDSGKKETTETADIQR
jgi:hypothetical protein